jgi:adenylate cyclase
MAPTESVLERGRVAIERVIDLLPFERADRASGSQEVGRKRDTLEAAYGNRAFQFLIRLARDLVAAASVPDALARTLDVAFEAFSVHRGFVVLRSNGGLRCEIARVLDHIEYRPEGPIPMSETIIERVITERIGLCTGDALRDDRLATTDSVWMHGIRAAMCVPLWSGEDIIGLLQVDSPVLVDTFTEHDLDFLIALANLAAIAVERIRDREARLRLQRYHSPAMVEQVLRESCALCEGTPLAKADVTVLFVDIVGFTALTESLPLEQVAEILSRFCQHVSDAVFLESGTVDKFMGDCVMAFFGAPVPFADHARRAVRAAIHVQEVVAQWSRDRVAAGLPAIQVRIGLNSGPVIVGDIGSPSRIDYTIIGKTVNVAARLEQCVAGPGDIVFADNTRRQLPLDVVCEPLGEVKLRGLESGINAFRIGPSSLEAWQMAL